MSDPLALGEQILALLDQSARSSTYKPALLLAIVDRAQDQLEDDILPVRDLAESVVELYWPQTLPYPTTGQVLLQNQAGGQALIIRRIEQFRHQTGSTSRGLPEAVRDLPPWSSLIDRTELVLAEWPIPRLQRPFGDFLYEFDWLWEETGSWSARSYRSGSRAIRLKPGVGAALISLGPLLRPFITRWWADKAARLNQDVEAALAMVEFEEFLFGRDRVSLARIAADLLAMQEARRCFYCGTRIATNVEVDHFIPWSVCGDDGIDNLVAACSRCNNEKRATLPGPTHLRQLLERNSGQGAELAKIASDRRWPRNAARQGKLARAAYLGSPPGRKVWSRTATSSAYEDLDLHREQLTALLA